MIYRPQLRQHLTVCKGNEAFKTTEIIARSQGRYLLNHCYKSFLTLFGTHDDVLSLEGLVVTVALYSRFKRTFCVSWFSFLCFVFNLIRLEWSTMMDLKLDLHLPKPRDGESNAA